MSAQQQEEADYLYIPYSTKFVDDEKWNDIINQRIIEKIEEIIEDLGTDHYFEKQGNLRYIYVRKQFTDEAKEKIYDFILKEISDDPHFFILKEEIQYEHYQDGNFYKNIKKPMMDYLSKKIPRFLDIDTKGHPIKITIDGMHTKDENGKLLNEFRYNNEYLWKAIEYLADDTSQYFDVMIHVKTR